MHYAKYYSSIITWIRERHARSCRHDRKLLDRYRTHAVGHKKLGYYMTVWTYYRNIKRQKILASYSYIIYREIVEQCMMTS